MPYALSRLRAALPCAALILLATPASSPAAVMRGTAKADRLIGSAAADTIKARGGADVVDGAGGADKVDAGKGNDRIQADGRDRVVGGAGRDRIQLSADALAFKVNCGPGKDRLTITAAVGVKNRVLAERAKGCERIRYVAGPVVAPVTDTADTAVKKDPLPIPLPVPLGPDTQPPSVPQGFRTTGKTQTSISVAWNASSDNVGVTGYRIYKNGTRIAQVTQTNYTLTGLACGTTYEIGLTAVDAAGNESYRPEAIKNESTSACSTPTPTPTPTPAPDTQPPSVPQGFTTTGKTQTSISVTWNASSDNVGVTGYRIYRNGTRIAQITQTNYTLTGLACNTTYEIGLTAIDAAGNESYRPQALKNESTSACSTPTRTSRRRALTRTPARRRSRARRSTAATRSRRRAASSRSAPASTRSRTRTRARRP
jgi:chitodextrinase